MAEKHTVKEGECLATIAKKYGFKRWQTIYEASENEEFCKKRPNPNVLYPGDEIVIPDKVQKEEACATEQKHRFKLKTSKWKLRIEMKDEEMNPLEDEPFEIHIDGMDVVKDRTGSGGLIEVDVPPEALSGKLFFMGEEIELDIDVLDPVSTIRGVQMRLNNLGYDAGLVDGMVSDKTRAAVLAFQSDQDGLEPTGKIDDAIRARLLEVHDNDQRVQETEEDMTYQGPMSEEPDELAEDEQEEPDEVEDLGGEEEFELVYPEDWCQEGERPFESFLPRREPTDEEREDESVGSAPDDEWEG